jgi:exodeoxyribonuclease III
MPSLSIVSWNIQQGGGSRVSLICSALIEKSYDIVMLSEFKNNHNGEKIKINLLNAGYKYQAISNAKKDENTVFVASKHACEYKTYAEADPNYTNNIINVKFSAFNLMAVYLPHKKKHNLFQFIIQETAANLAPTIIVGDYNTGHNYIDQKGDSFWYQPELQALESNYFKDAFRYINKNSEEYSWFSHQGNGYRYDHTYVHEQLLAVVKNCYYLHEWRQNKLSDHSPMVIELG